MPKPKFPKQIYVKREYDNTESWLIAQETPGGIVDADDEEIIAIYQLVRIAKASAPTRVE